MDLTPSDYDTFINHKAVFSDRAEQFYDTYKRFSGQQGSCDGIQFFPDTISIKWFYYDTPQEYHGTLSVPAGIFMERGTWETWTHAMLAVELKDNFGCQVSTQVVTDLVNLVLTHPHLHSDIAYMLDRLHDP